MTPAERIILRTLADEYRRRGGYARVHAARRLALPVERVERVERARVGLPWIGSYGTQAARIEASLA